MTRPRLAGPVSLANLLNHCRLYGPDRFIAEDFAAVQDCAASEDDAEALARYRRARMRAPGFARGSWQANNHRNIPERVLRELTEGNESGKLTELTCTACGTRFTARRADRRSCSDRCRQRRSRSRRTTVVTPTSP